LRLLDSICITFERPTIIIIVIGRHVQLTFSNIEPMFAVTNKTRVEDSQAILDWDRWGIDNHDLYFYGTSARRSFAYRKTVSDDGATAFDRKNDSASGAHARAGSYNIAAIICTHCNSDYLVVNTHTRAHR